MDYMGVFIFKDIQGTPLEEQERGLHFRGISVADLMTGCQRSLD